MHGDQHFFELPIYLESESAYYRRLNEQVEQSAQHSWQRTNDPRKDLDWHRRIARSRYHLALQRYGGAWTYNQIVGFLGIYPLGDQLRGATWYSERKLVRRTTGRREIGLDAKAFELTVPPQQQSAEIFSALLQEVCELRKHKPYKGRHLDIRALELGGPFLDWRRLMDISQRTGLYGVHIESLPDLLVGRFDRLGVKAPPRSEKWWVL